MGKKAQENSNKDLCYDPLAPVIPQALAKSYSIWSAY